MKEEKVIYSRKLAFELRKCGFQIIRTEINEYHPQFDTYIFELTPELSAAIGRLTAQ